jgi:hypothetical protein
MKEGEQICVGETGYKICHDGQFIEDNCPPKSKCLQSPTSKAVLCREYRRNINVDQGKQEPVRR